MKKFELSFGERKSPDEEILHNQDTVLIGVFARSAGEAIEYVKDRLRLFEVDDDERQHHCYDICGKDRCK